VCVYSVSGDENAEDLVSTDDDDEEDEDDDEEIYHDADPGQSFSLDNVKDLNFEVKLLDPSNKSGGCVASFVGKGTAVCSGNDFVI